MEEIVSQIRRIIPPLSVAKYKGQAGKIAVVGGSLEYTGAPYFAAITTLRLGADLAHVFCEMSAAIPIKGYSPDLIVHPFIDFKHDETPEHSAQRVIDWMPRLNTLVLGPGMGRNEKMFGALRAIVHAARERELPLVFDGDALWYVSQHPDVVRGYTKAVLTPNEMEYQRIVAAVFPDVEKKDSIDITSVAKQLGGVTVLRKGQVDQISDGNITFQCEANGGPRRCGGQGDITAGAVGTLLCWGEEAAKTQKLIVPTTVLAGYGGVLLSKAANALAFERHKRSMVTSDMVEYIGTAFETLFGEEEE